LEKGKINLYLIIFDKRLKIHFGALLFEYYNA
jgi:hypothetical protein